MKTTGWSVLATTGLYGLSVVCGLSLFLAVSTVTGHRLSTQCSNGCASYADYEKADPICITDPACVSPFFNFQSFDSSGPQRSRPLWVGLDWWSLDYEGWTTLYHEKPLPNWQLLAPPNYLMFLLLAGSATTTVSARLSGRIRKAGLIAIFTICIVAVASWFYDAATFEYDPSHGPLLLEALITLALSGAVLWTAASIALPERSGTLPPEGRPHARNNSRRD
jgi:hypothetical protein